MHRCEWAGTTDPLMIRYHDEVWGVPCRDDRQLFERLMLEGFQAGLSWRTILHKRDTFARAFDGWDAERIARYGAEDIARLMADPGIVRNRLKVEATIRNARAYLELERPFSEHVWSFVDGHPIVNRPTSISEIPPTTAISDALSKDLRKRGFTFVGSTIMYAFMQSVGMVDDHVVGCVRK